MVYLEIVMPGKNPQDGLSSPDDFQCCISFHVPTFLPVLSPFPHSNSSFSKYLSLGKGSWKTSLFATGSFVARVSQCFQGLSWGLSAPATENQNDFPFPKAQKSVGSDPWKQIHLPYCFCVVWVLRRDCTLYNVEKNIQKKNDIS